MSALPTLQAQGYVGGQRASGRVDCRASACCVGATARAAPASYVVRTRRNAAAAAAGAEVAAGLTQHTADIAANGVEGRLHAQHQV
jgi:hypothetical protein